MHGVRRWACPAWTPYRHTRLTAPTLALLPSPPPPPLGERALWGRDAAGGVVGRAAVWRHHVGRALHGIGHTAHTARGQGPPIRGQPHAAAGATAGAATRDVALAGRGWRAAVHDLQRARRREPTRPCRVCGRRTLGEPGRPRAAHARRRLGVRGEPGRPHVLPLGSAPGRVCRAAAQDRSRTCNSAPPPPTTSF